MSYSKLLAGCKQTDEEAFERLFAQYKPMMAKAVRKYSRAYSMHCQHDIQDMQQIARIAFWKADRTFDLNKVPSGINLENDFSAFAKKTIEGRLMDSMKKKQKWTSHEKLKEDDTPLDLPDRRITDDTLAIRDLLERSFPLLSLREKEYLILSVYKGKRTKDIAQEKNVSENTVRSWKKTSRKKLAQIKDELLHSAHSNKPT